VPRFAPFRGLRYDGDRVDFAAVTAPPYDVIDRDARGDLAARSAFNAVHVDCPVDDGSGDCYRAAAEQFGSWRRDGILVADGAPALTAYRMTYTDERGAPRSTLGVIGELGLEEPGTGDVLPHEHTTPKAKSDRLQLLEATRANLSAVWGLSLATELTKLIDPGEPPAAAWVDDDGVGHEMWPISDPAVVQPICDAVAGAPVVIADGHHRYETCLAYARDHAGDTAAQSTMALVVELAEEQLDVEAIHRIVAGVPAGFDFLAALEPFFEIVDARQGLDEGRADPAALLARMADAGALALVHPHGTALLRPRPSLLGSAAGYDSSRLDVALRSLPPHEVTFQHGADNVFKAVGPEDGPVGFLLRPVSVAQIAEVAHNRDRMPPKTTFFWPKPKTGLVFRPFDV